jgi:hypothetical protein
MNYTENKVSGAKQSNAVNTGAPESGDEITITKDLETWGWLANGIGLLLSMSIVEMSKAPLGEEDAGDVQCVAGFCQEINQQLLERYQ